MKKSSPCAVVNLKELQTHIRKLAARAGLRDADLPTFGSSADGGRPHIETIDGVYYYVVCERGTELERTLFIDENELYYLALRDATAQVVGDRVLAARGDEFRDSRRERFRLHEDLMRQIEPAWAKRVSQEYAAVLRKHPFDDAAAVRARRAAALRASGVEAESAWRRACDEYPLPTPAED